MASAQRIIYKLLMLSRNILRLEFLICSAGAVVISQSGCSGTLASLPQLLLSFLGLLLVLQGHACISKSWLLHTWQ